VIKAATRLLRCIALLAALAWVAFPAVIVAGASAAGMQSEPCPCCDGKATTGAVIACPGCQVGMPAVAASAPRAAVAVAWTALPGIRFTGTDPTPAEPPPR
jgi:hypothetical protein